MLSWRKYHLKCMKIRRNICILTAVHPVWDSRIFHREAKTLVRAGYEVSFIVPHDKEEIIEGVRIIPLPKPNNRFSRMTRGAWRLFRLALKEKSDIYHFHDPEIIPVGILLKLLTRSQVIYDVHENIPAQILAKKWIPFYIRTVISNLFNCIQKICFLFFDAIIVAGDDIAENLLYHEKIKVVRNFPPLEEIKRNTWRKRGKEKRQIRLIYIGLMTQDRGIQQMVEAVRLIKDDIKLVLVGDFDDAGFYEHIKGISDRRVEFVGQVSYGRVFEYLRGADIGLILFHAIPNNIEAIKGRNRKIFEYMATGLPIVASDLRGWRKAIEDRGYGVVVDPLDPKDIANGMKRLIDNPQLRTKMGQQCISSCLNEFNWEKEEQVFLKVYEDTLARGVSG